METINPSKNEDVKSVTPLTDEELKKFNTEAEYKCFLPIRKGIKDVLDVILITVKYYYRHFSLGNEHPDFSADALTDSITKTITAVMHHVDEMDATELAKIAEHANYVYDAFKLVEPYIPDGVLPRSYQLIGITTQSPLDGYLRKVWDIFHILSITSTQYKGSDVGYGSAIYLKNHLAEYPGGKATTTVIPGDPGYVVYTNKPVVCTNVSIYQVVMLTLKQWADKNLDDNSKDKFFAFLLRHESGIIKYIKLEQLKNPLSGFDYTAACTFFYRWFLKEQAS